MVSGIYIAVIVGVAVAAFFGGYFVGLAPPAVPPIRAELIFAYANPNEIQVYHNQEISIGVPVHYIVFPPTFKCKPESGEIFGLGNTDIECTSVVTAAVQKFPVYIERSESCASVPDAIPSLPPLIDPGTEPGTIAQYCGLASWVKDGNNIAPTMLIRNGNDITIKSYGLSMNANVIDGTITLFNTQSKDPIPIVEKWSLLNPDNPVATKFSSISADCDGIPVVTGSIICNTTSVTLKFSTELPGSRDFSVAYISAGDGTIKPKVTFRGSGQFRAAHELTFQVDKVFADSKVVSLKEADDKEAKRINVEQPTNFVFVKENQVVLRINEDPAISKAQSRYALKPEGISSTYGVKDTPNFAPFVNSFEIDPTYSTDPAVQTTHYVKSSGGAGENCITDSDGVSRCLSKVDNGTTMSIGEQGNCGTGNGICILRAISKWDITSVTQIPPNDQITNPRISLLYSTDQNAGTPSAGTIRPIANEPPGTAETNPTTLNNAWIDAKSGTAFISSWNPEPMKIYDCLVTLTGHGACPVLTGAVDDFRNHKSAGNWYAIGYESDDESWGPDSDVYRTVNGVGSSSQKPVLKIYYKCNNNSPNAGCT